MTLDEPHPNSSGVRVGVPGELEQAPEGEENSQEQKSSQAVAPDANQTEGRKPISLPQQKDNATARPAAKQDMVDEAVQTNLDMAPPTVDHVGLPNAAV